MLKEIPRKLDGRHHLGQTALCVPVTFLLPPPFKWRSISEKMSQMVHYRSSKEDFGERPKQNRSRRIQQEEKKRKVEPSRN